MWNDNKCVFITILFSGQIFDLGLKRIHFSDQHVINHTIEELDESIDFVLIGDYMDESLVLLKRALCWDLDDILYFTHRRRSSDYKELNITTKMKVWTETSLENI
jgi:hypothetical protein